MTCSSRCRQSGLGRLGALSKPRRVLKEGRDHPPAEE